MICSLFSSTPPQNVQQNLQQKKSRLETSTLVGHIDLSPKRICRLSFDSQYRKCAATVRSMSPMTLQNEAFMHQICRAGLKKYMAGDMMDPSTIPQLNRNPAQPIKAAQPGPHPMQKEKIVHKIQPRMLMIFNNTIKHPNIAHIILREPSKPADFRYPS